MKNHLPGFLCLVLFPALFVSTSIFAQSEFDPLGQQSTDSMEKQIRIQLEWIEMSHEKATELMAKNRRTRVEGLLSSNDQPLRDELTELIKKGEAKVADTISVIARSGNRAKAESVLEFVYPTEYDPPHAATGTGDDEESNTVVTTPTPTAFETRNIGATLEVDPVLGADNVTVDLNLSPELVFNTGFENYGSHKEGESKVDVVMAKFFMVKVTTQITARDSEPLMISVLSPRNMETGESDSSRKFMVFVKADVLYTGLPIDRK